MMADVLQLAVNGLALGSVYALSALGFIVVYSTTSAINFAAGQFVMVATFMGVAVLAHGGVPNGAGYPLVLLGMAAFGLVFFSIVYLPLRGATPAGMMIGTLSVGITLQSLVGLIFGPWPVRLTSPVDGMQVDIGGAVIAMDSVVAIVTTVVLAVLLWLLLQKTNLGIALRAVSQDRDVARLMGLRVTRLLAFSWALAAILAGIAGLLIAPLWFADANMGDPIALKAFAATIIGGFGSLPGAILGGVIVGVAEVFGASYVSSAYKDVIAFGGMIAFLLLRPQGILGERIQDKA